MMGHEQGNTRARIQSVALELFVEQGYDKTSLREIAERLGVTKAALYYHFKSKDEIVVSVVEDLLAEIDDIIAWARSQPQGPATRLGIVRRYADATMRWRTCIRFFQHNPRSENTHSDRFRQRVGELHELLVEPDRPLPQRMRALSAIVSMHVAAISFAEAGYDDGELHAAMLEVAGGLVNHGEELVDASAAGDSVGAAAHGAAGSAGS